MATDMAADATPASGDDAGRVDLAVVNDAEGLVEEPDQVGDEHIHEIMRQAKTSASLFIGDYTASQDYDLLRELGISVVIAAMRQKYTAPDDIELNRVLIDDDARTNVMAHFPRVNDIIHEALAAGKSVLVHCQAGVSRSTTLCAAFLMHEFGLTTDEAVERISAVRSVVNPTEFFMAQLEMYERCDCEVDAAKHMEYRRFLMAFSHAEFMDGDPETATLYLAYYPSPAPTPRDRSPSDPFRSLRMTPVLDGPGGFNPIRRRSSSHAGRPDILRRGSSAGSSGPPPELRMTPSRSASQSTGVRPSRSELDSWANERRPSRVAAETLARERESLRAEALRVAEGKERLLAVGKGRVQVKGRRLRCKMCNRELAARQHMIEHEPGEGQQAFAINRRDMAQHRLDEQKRKEDRARRERVRAEREGAKKALAETQANGDSAPATTTTTAGPSQSSLNNRLPTQLAGLRVAMPPPFRPPPSMATVVEPAEDGRPSPSVDDCAIDDTETPGEDEPDSPPLLASSTCSSYFTEPLSWMQDLLEPGDLGGRIVCPNKRCAAKLGSFDWAGVQCSCGSWVVPGFALNASKVDEIAA